jgi:hypothetical protein
MNMPKILISLTIFSLAAVAAHANLLTNGSFENTNNAFVGDANKTDELLSGSAAIPGWTTANAQLAWIENGNPYGISAANGSFFLDLTGYVNASPYGGVTQSFATTIGTQYVVTFDLGYGGNNAAYGGPVSVTASAGGSSQVFTSGSGTPNPAVWNLETFDFTATSSTTTLSLTGFSASGGAYIGLDNVDAEVAGSTTTPEPGTWSLLFAGIGLIGGSARFRRRSLR